MNELQEAVLLIEQPGCKIFVADIGPSDFGLHFGDYNVVHDEDFADEIDDADRQYWSRWDEDFWINLPLTSVARLKQLGVELSSKYETYYFSRELLWNRSHQ